MMLKPAMRLAAFAYCCGITGVAFASDPLPATTQLVGSSSAAAPVQESFTIATAQDLVVTLTDLQVPAELVSAGVVVTQAGAIAGSGQLSAPATNASVSLPAASGLYTLYVFGVPSATYSVGTFSVCVAPKASPSNCIQTVTVPGVAQPEVVSFSGNITAANSAKDPTVSTLSQQLTVTTAGSYTFNFGDLAFPIALNQATSPNPTLALFQGSTPIIPSGQSTPGLVSGTALNLSPGTYTLLAIAQADANVQQGLYAITIAGPSGTAPLFSAAVPVGLLSPGTTCYNPSSQSATLTVTDYVFPGPAALASASALVTSGGTAVGTANAAGGAQTLTVPAGNVTLWTYGSLGANAGTFSADLSAGGSDLCLTAQGVGPSSGSSNTTYAYAFVAPAPTVTVTSGVPVTSYMPLAAGAYTATAADLQFPAQLSGLSFAVAQHDQVLQKSPTAATLNVSAAAGNVVVLASAVASTSSASGLFDVNLQATGTSASLAFDKTQSVSSTPGLFNAQTITVADNASYEVSLTDLKFPAALDSLALVVSRGSQVLGEAFGSAPVTFSGSPGNYLLTFVATPSADQQFGLYSESVVYAPPTVTLTSSVATAATGSSITLSSSSTNATSCAATGGWTGTLPTTATTTTETLSATSTYTLTCTGAGGSATQSVTVTATAAPASGGGGGGGGSMDPGWLIGLGALLGTRFKRIQARTRS
jgi:hypothetical protein